MVLKTALKYTLLALTIVLFQLNSFGQKKDSLIKVNLQLLDSARKYCKLNYYRTPDYSFEKTNFFIKQLIKNLSRQKNDSLLAEVYLIKMENYSNNADKYQFRNFDSVGVLYKTVRICLDSVNFFLPYNYSKYNQVRDDMFEALNQAMDALSNARRQIKSREFETTTNNLEKSNNRNTLFLYLLIFSSLIIGLIIYFLNVNRKKNKKIKLLLKDIQTKNHEIIDSINYAKRLQNAIMTSEKYIERTLNRLNKKD